MTHAKRPLYEELGGLLLHIPPAVPVGILAAIVLRGLLGIMFAPFGIRILSLGDIYNPFPWLPAAFLGFTVNRLTPHRSAGLVGATGFLSLLAIMLWDISIFQRSEDYRSLTQGQDWAYEFGQLFSLDYRKCGASECLEKLFVTAPSLICVAYSVRAWVGFQCGYGKAPLERPSNV